MSKNKIINPSDDSFNDPTMPLEDMLTNLSLGGTGGEHVIRPKAPKRDENVTAFEFPKEHLDLLLKAYAVDSMEEFIPQLINLATNLVEAHSKGFTDLLVVNPETEEVIKLPLKLVDIS